jgi:hypothetical protein
VIKLGSWFFSVGIVLVVACSAATERDGGAPVPCETVEDCSTGVCDPTAKTCVECLRDSDCSDEDSCKGRQCVERTRCENTLACPNGQVCGREEGYCAECFRDSDCVDGACVNEECRPRCVSDKDCAELGRLCDFARNACVDCIDDGDCPASEFCGNGACRPDECVPGATRCAENDVVAFCASNGSFAPGEFCSPGICTENDGIAWCLSMICVPHSAFCDEDGARAMRCSDDGLEVDVLEDCQADDRVCIAGECTEPVCDPGQRVCDGRRILECNPIGARLDVVDACADGFYCDPEIASCVAGKCTPGEKACSSGGVVTCSLDGSAFEGRVACEGDQVCLEGACVPEVCEAETSFCHGGHPWECDDSGKVTGRADTCTSVEYCDDETASCKTKVCTENSNTCVGNAVRTCDALGSSYTDEDCGSESACVAGECRQKICEPNTYYCGEDGNPYECYAEGSSAIQLDTCSEFEICKVNGDSTAAGCSPLGGEGGAGD